MSVVRKYLSITGLLAIVRSEFKKINLPREVDRINTIGISFADCLMSAFAMFSQKYPSLLQFDKCHRLDPQVEHNLKTLYGMEKIPCDTYMRERLDEGSPSAVRITFKRLFAFLQRGKALESYQYLNGRYLLAGDGTGFFKSKSIHCDQCCVMHEHKVHVKIGRYLDHTLVKQHSYILLNSVDKYFELYHFNADGEFIKLELNTIAGLEELLSNKRKKNELSKDDKELIKQVIKAYHYSMLSDDAPTYYHNMYCAAIVHPDQKVVIPLAPEPIMRSDGDSKNDCERNASKRLYNDLKREHPHLKVIVVEDSLASNHPHLAELNRLDMQFIAGVKKRDHEFLFNWVDDQTCQIYEHTTEDGTTHRYRYINSAPLNKAHADFKINFMEYWETNKKGKIQHFCWVTDILINNDNAYDIMRGGRANWKVENPIFNTLKNLNYNFTHNFGHGYKNLSTILAMLMLLAFLVDQIQELCCTMFQQALKKRESKTGLWKKMQSMFTSYFINSWNDLFHAIIHGPPRIVLGTDSS